MTPTNQTIEEIIVKNFDQRYPLISKLIEGIDKKFPKLGIEFYDLITDQFLQLSDAKDAEWQGKLSEWIKKTVESEAKHWQSKMEEARKDQIKKDAAITHNIAMNTNEATEAVYAIESQLNQK